MAEIEISGKESLKHSTQYVVCRGKKLRSEKGAEALGKRLHHFHLDESVLLWPHPFTSGSVVVHTGLALQWREYGVPGQWVHML